MTFLTSPELSFPAQRPRDRRDDLGRPATDVVVGEAKDLPALSRESVHPREIALPSPPSVVVAVAVGLDGDLGAGVSEVDDCDRPAAIEDAMVKQGFGKTGPLDELKESLLEWAVGEVCASRPCIEHLAEQADAGPPSSSQTQIGVLQPGEGDEVAADDVVDGVLER